MIKLILSVSLFCLTISAQSQGIEVGLKGGYGTTWLLNKNVFDQGEELDAEASFAGNFGLNFTYYFNPKIALELEINSQTVNQKYTGEVIEPISSVTEYTFEATDRLKYMQIPLLFKLQTEHLIYIEVGPQLLLLNQAKEDGTLLTQVDPGLSGYSGSDIKTGFNSTSVGLLFGFGVNIKLIDHLFLNTGLRLGGSFTDITKQYSKEEFNSSISSYLGIATRYANHDSSGNLNYKKTTLATGAITLGVAYKFGKKQN